MKTIKRILFIPIIAAIAAGCAGLDAKEIAQEPAVNVSVETAVRMALQATVSVSGKIEAINSANISTRMMGNITKVLVEPGTKVRKGDLLIALSSADLSAKKAQVEASIAQAQSAFNLAEKDYERFQNLHEKGSASDKELENVTAHYKMTKAGLIAAKEMQNEVNAQFTYSNIRAPFDGIVANTFVKVGDIAHPGMPLVAVEGASNYVATVLIPESQIGQVKLDAKAKVIIKSLGSAINGTVIEVSPSAKNTGGQYIAKIRLDDTSNILPGMFANVKITVDAQQSSKTGPMVKQSSIIRMGQLTGIYTLTNDKVAILRWIRTGELIDDKIEIISGLSDGEHYIVSAEGKLYNGVSVEFEGRTRKNN